MKRIIRNILIIIFLGISIKADAQTYVTPVRSDLTPPTPQSSAIMEVQTPQPDLLTGAVSLSVPIYDIKLHNFELPVALQYHTNGIKVFDDPVPLGYGWNLMPALRITRTVLGRPDELYQFSGDPQQYVDPTGMCYMSSVNSKAQSYYYPERYDSEHDIINISLPNKTLTRVIDTSSGDFEFIGACDNEYSVSASKDLSTITVIDPLGIKYLYGGINEYCYNSAGELIKTAWPLYKIILDNGQTVELQWSHCRHPFVTREWFGGSSFKDNWDLYQWSNSGTGQGDFDVDNYGDGVLSRNSETEQFIQLNGIEFPGGSIGFDYQWVPNTGSMLTAINVSSTEEVVKTIQLSYVDDNYTLLKNIDAGEGNIYKFDYEIKYGTKPFTDWDYRHSQDWWGYFNNKTNSTLSPKMNIKTFITTSDSFTSPQYREIDGADRSIDSEAMKALIMTKVTWPTGGTSAFEYEPHHFSPSRLETNGEIDPSYDPYLTEGGGLRIKRITTSAGGTDKNMTVRYEYPEARVRAVPSAATFVEVYNVVFAMPDVPSFNSDPVARMRMVNVMPMSDYMRYDIGVTPLWYDKVTTYWEEGKTETFFEDILATPAMSPMVSYGNRIPTHMTHIFDGAPAMTRQVVYKSDGEGYTPVETTEFKYTSSLGNKVLTNYHIKREIVYTEPNENNCPDLIDGWYIYGGPKEKGTLQRVENGYSSHFYGIYPYAKRLVEKKHTIHTETGDITTSEEYTYRRNSGLVTSVVTTTSEGTPSKVEIEYADAGNGGVEAQMVQSNVVGVPLRETISRGAAQIDAEAEYIQTASGAFRQKRTSVSYGGMSEKLFSPLCEFTFRGNLRKVTDADGITTQWSWDAKELYPILKNQSGLKTVFEYKPLVGLAGITEPFGTTTKYEYDNFNRLKSSEIDGLGKIQEIFYNLVENNNYISVSTILDDTRTHTVTERFDNLGRKTVSEDCVTGISQYFKYDVMGRLYAASVPSTDAPTTDSDYSLTFFEPSPRGVVVSSVRNGKEWQDGARYVTVRTLTNETEGSLSCPLYEIGAGGNVIFKGKYLPGQIVVEETTDENGHVSRSYTNKSGLVVMTEEGDGGAEMLRTRNVYDAYGRLRFILPPSFEDGSFVTSDDSFIKNCYEFEYDALGRLVSSRNPGSTARKRTVYSAAGRTVAEHTPSMSDNNWFVHFYDNKGRLCYTAQSGLLESEVDRLKTEFSLAEYTGNTEYAGYRLVPQPMIPADDPFSAVYYDDYRFLDSADASALPKISGERPGLQTGAYDASTGYSAIVYDDWGRIAGKHTRTAKGIKSTAIVPDRSGAPLSVTTTLNGMTVARNNSYDAAGRLADWSTTLNDVSASGKLTYGPMGGVIKEAFGNSVNRTYDYDPHGWVTRISTEIPLQFSKPPRPGFEFGQLSDDFYSQVYGLQPDFDLTPGNVYTETILYGEGAAPRWDGTASAHVSTLGGRYDYFFDCHDRLVKAAYSEPDSKLTEGITQDFSTEYTYNEVGVPLTVTRRGVTEVTGGELLSVEHYGLMDELSYDWDGMLLNSVTAQPHGSDFYGRTGYRLSSEGGEGIYSWTKAGLLNSDSARGITGTTYNWNGQPQRITFDDGGYLQYAWRSDGSLKSVATYAVLTGGKRAVKVSERHYIGDFVFEGDSLLYVNFSGGYFDGEGKAHYRHTDWQGNVTMVTDAQGALEQHTGYYPYGEPWREPKGQPLLYGGKERLRDNSLNEYDFSARRLNSSLCLWTTPDPLSEKNINVNPYSYCLGNPIGYIDTDGKEPTDLEAAYMASFIYEDNKDSQECKEILNHLKTWLIDEEHSCNIDDSETGFKSALFRRELKNGKSEYVLVFAGTDPLSWKDWENNFKQFNGESDQYKKAVETGVKLSKELGNESELTFVGHSMGAGQATAASLATGRNAITFNPAFLSKKTKENLNLKNKQGKIKNFITIGKTFKIGKLIISIGGDWLYNFQTKTKLQPEGKIYFLRTNNLCIDHSLDTIIRILSKCQK